MIKSSELLVVVDSVEEAVKFYTEKMAFDLVDAQVSPENSNLLIAAHVRKGKCHIIFRAPQVEELADFSFIKRCASRCAGLYVEVKKGLDRYFERCQKKGVKVVSEPRMVDGHRTFVVKDPFGMKLAIAEVPEKVTQPSTDFVGMRLSQNDIVQKTRKESEMIDDMAAHLRKFGILRRAAKKFAKSRLKQFTKKK